MMYDKSTQGVAAQPAGLASAHTRAGRAAYVAPAAPGVAEERTAMRNRSELTVDAIKRYIVEHALRPGDPLPTEARLCEDLNVSRTSVREALRRLEALDIVRSQQGRGSFLGEMSLGPMVETVVLRNALDGHSGAAALKDVARTRQYLDLGMAEELVETMRGRSHPDLREIVDQMLAAVERGESYMDLDIAFHEALALHLGNTLVSQLVRAMWLIHQAVIPHLGPQLPEALHAAALTHVRMLDAAEAGDVEAFRRAVCEHYAPLQSLIEGEGGEG